MASKAAERKPAVISATDDWRLLQAQNVYRLLLLALLISLQQAGTLDLLFEDSRPRLFYGVCVAYALAALGILVPALYRRPTLSVQALVNFALDTGAIVLLVYASGGVAGGLGILAIPPVIAASLLLSTRLAMAVAAMATLAMFGEEVLGHYPYLYATSNFTATGVLGIIFFITAGVANAVARRARASEALALRVGSEFEDLARLNETVIDTMQTGVLVVDAGDTVRALNHAAARMLHCAPDSLGTPLGQHSPALAAAVTRWRDGSAAPEEAISPERQGASELLPRFRRLGSTPESPTLVLLEDAQRVREQAQQIKLAALGRMSASIAHEIRNPLAAITHAGQLLAESSALPAADRRLLDIIQRHGQRIDRIVKDVLNLSRGAADPQVFALGPWLQQMLAQYREAHPTRQPQLELRDHLLVRFDAHHLQQVLFNLLDNAWLHARQGEKPVQVRIRVSQLYPRGGALDVQDNGPGIPPETAEHLFEPFFTTTTQGTGLGLYLARELCAYNQARLSLLAPEAPPVDGTHATGALFRIAFVAPDSEEPGR